MAHFDQVVNRSLFTVCYSNTTSD